jgi:hypothetical protein
VNLSALTTAQLETMRDNLVAAHAKALLNYSIEGLTVNRPDPEAILRQLDVVSEELAARSDTTGGVIVVQFEEPGDRS